MGQVNGDNTAGMRIGEENWKVRGGAEVNLRVARTADEVPMRAFIDSLSRESRYFRFLTGGRVSDDIIRGFVSHRSDRDVAMVVTARDANGAEVIVANAEYVVSADNIAELAVVVADDWQGQGLGRRLIQRLQQIARARSLDGMRGDVLSENRRMLAIMRDCGFSARRNPEDSFLHEVRLALRDTHVNASAQPASSPSDTQQVDRLPRDWFAAN